MFRVASIFLLTCLAVSVPAHARDDRAPRGPEDASVRERAEIDDRRAQVREMREEFRSMREQLYRQPPLQAPRRHIADQEPDPRLSREPALRRLDPDERERLRRAMREAAREHYGR